MLVEDKFRSLCKECFSSSLGENDFLSILFGKLTVCYGSNGIIEDAFGRNGALICRTEEEGKTLLEIGFQRDGRVYRIDPTE